MEKIPEPFNEIMYDQMLQLISWIAEEESKKRSERVKNAVRKEEGITKSCKGNKWGRKVILSDSLKKEALRLRQEGQSIRQTATQLNISPSSVFKLLSKNIKEESA